MDVRYWIDGIIILIIAVLLQIYTDELVEAAIKQDVYGNQYRAILVQIFNPSIDSQGRQSLINEAEVFKQFWINEAVIAVNGFERLLIYNLVLLFSYLLKNLTQIQFAYIRNKKPDVVIPELCMNCFGLVLTIYILFFYWFHYVHVDPEIFKDDSNHIDIILKMTSDKHMKFQFTASLIIAIQWARVFFVFQASKAFGPLIKILTSMLVDVSRFAIIYVLAFVTFFTVGRIMFIELEDFQQSSRAIAYLFSACLGNFDFTIFNEPMTLPYYSGYLFLILFLILMSIILTNFIIAILTNVYMIWHKYDEGLYLRQIVMIRQVLQKHDIHSSLISAIAPLNLVTVPFSLLNLIYQSERLNS